MSLPQNSKTNPTASKRYLNWSSIIWVVGMHIGAICAPFFFSWSALVVFGILYVVTGLGITVGYHRLLTHRSFQTSKPMEYILTLFGVLANEGGPLKWVAVHRKHHTHSDNEGDPHSPKTGFWWAHIGWWIHYDPILDDPISGKENIKDLVKDPVHRFFEVWQILPPILLGIALYFLGNAWGDVGWSWVLWGIFVRTTLVFHSTWLVNSATHMWGYRNYPTRDHSTNLWWVALLSFGEGWHNNHHAYQRSARHGLRWWEIDLSWIVIYSLALVGLARNIHLAPAPKAKEHSPASRWRVLFPIRKLRGGSLAMATAPNPATLAPTPGETREDNGVADKPGLIG